MSSSDHHPKQRIRKWTEFEMHTLLSLICKGVHRTGPSADKNATMLKLTEKLNHAVNQPRGEDDWHENDMEVDDVMYMMQQVTKEKQAALRLIERQVPSRITRAKTRAFARNLGFSDSVQEWESGRGMEEKERQAAQFQQFRDRMKERQANHMLRLHSDEAVEPKSSSQSRRPTLCPKANESVPPQTSQHSDHMDQSVERHDMVDSSPMSASKARSRTPEGPSATGWSGGFAQPSTSATDPSFAPATPRWGVDLAQSQATPLWQHGSPYWQGEQERDFGETGTAAEVSSYSTGQALHSTGFASTSLGHLDTALHGVASPARGVMWGGMGSGNGADDRFQRGYDAPALSLPYSSGWVTGFDNFAAGTPLPNTLGLDENDTGLSHLQGQSAARQPHGLSAQTPLVSGSGGHGAGTLTGPSDLQYRGAESGSAAAGHLGASKPFVHPDRRFAGQN